MHVQLTPFSGGNPDERYWLARVDGGPEFRVDDYAVQTEGQDGNVVMSLVVTVDALSIGDASRSGESRPAVPEKPPASTWGDGSKPDPRESIPGWEPEKVSGKVAESLMTRMAAAANFRTVNA
jgi:hypothetical protein